MEGWNDDFEKFRSFSLKFVMFKATEFFLVDVSIIVDIFHFEDILQQLIQWVCFISQLFIGEESLYLTKIWSIFI